MVNQLKFLYGDNWEAIGRDIDELARKYKTLYDIDRKTCEALTEKDSILITYGDSIIDTNKKPLEALEEFMSDDVGDAVKSIHILPFYPYSSDDGFSVIDYLKVNEHLGRWADIEKLGENYDLMFDAVINHISAKSEWFRKFREGEEEYRDFFIVADPKKDYSMVTRPRALPLLTPVMVGEEEKHVWTTFSADQIDLNYENPKVFVKVLGVLLEYAVRGAKFIRLDAIGFAWKKEGTVCIHLEETHALIQIIREVLTSVKSDMIIITETNVPHKENISYFGDGYNEAHMVYQFPLPPLTLYTLLSGNTDKLLKWADSLGDLSSETTYFNFLASHDGVGLRPVEGILSEDEKQIIVDSVLENGGLINYKNNSDGSKSPYELNINYMDALGGETEEAQILIDRFLAAAGILFSLVGVPGIYIHSLIGSGNYIEGVKESGINRRINREKIDLTTLREELLNSQRRMEIFEGNKKLLNIRRKEAAFNPYGNQDVYFIDSRLFTIKRTSLDGESEIKVVINISREKVSCPFKGEDLLAGEKVNMKSIVEPYQIMWIK